jgi:hypothetical protein
LLVLGKLTLCARQLLEQLQRSRARHATRSIERAACDTRTGWLGSSKRRVG